MPPVVPVISPSLVFELVSLEVNFSTFILCRGRALSGSVLPSLASWAKFSKFTDISFSLDAPTAHLPLTELVIDVAGAVTAVDEFVEVFVRCIDVLMDSPIMDSLLAVVFTPGRLAEVVSTCRMAVVANSAIAVTFSTLAGDLCALFTTL